VVLMDLAMPGVNGIEATRAIEQSHPGTAVLVPTMAGTDDSLVAALRAGARGYLLKEAGRQEISHALWSVAAGQAVFGTSVADRILGRLTEPPRGKPGTSTAFPSSPSVRSRSSACSPAACPTTPSPPCCTYPTRPYATTSAASWPRPAHPTGTPPPWPARRAWAASPVHKHLAANRVRRDAPPLPPQRGADSGSFTSRPWAIRLTSAIGIVWGW
jgi:hypothetical protein